MMALGIGPGDEVICPSFTFFATAGAVFRTGGKPIFVDICPDCFTIDPVSIKDAMTSQTKAIIPVHLFGQAADMLSISDIAGNIPVIEDAAQAIGCELDNHRVGGLGTTGCFSFFPSKNLGGYGDAGLITTNDDQLAEKIRLLRVHGGEGYIHRIVGGNFRIDALQAALLLVKLNRLAVYESNRHRNAQIYYQKLTGCESISLPKITRGKHVFNQFTIQVRGGRRKALQSYLARQGISTGIYYPLPLHQQECFKGCVPHRLSLPVTELLAQQCLSLPIAAELQEDQIEFVANQILAFCER